MCTGIRFTDSKGNLFFGRNYDWSFSYGEKVFITPRGYDRAWAFNGDAAGDAKQRALVGTAIVVDDVPLYFDCANEDGLAVAGLNFTEFGRFEKGPVEGKCNVTAYEFPLWVASRFSTVDDLVAALDDLAIVAKPINDKYPVAFLHWLIADAKRSIVVEYMDSGLHVHDDDVDVLTNQPQFDWHRENLRNYLALDPAMPVNAQWRGQQLSAFGSGFGMLGLPGGFSSPDRFVRAAYLNAHYPEKATEAENVSRLFHTLAGVAMVEGGAAMADGSFEITIYTGGYSQATRTYYYNTYDDPAIRSVAMDGYDLEGSAIIAA